MLIDWLFGIKVIIDWLMKNKCDHWLADGNNGAK